MEWRPIIDDFLSFCKKHQITNLEFVDYWRRITKHDDVNDARKEFESIVKVFEPAVMVS